MESNKMMSRLLQAVKEKDPIFVFIEDDIVTSLVVGGFITIKGKQEDMSGTEITDAGLNHLALHPYKRPFNCVNVVDGFASCNKQCKFCERAKGFE